MPTMLVRWAYELGCPFPRSRVLAASTLAVVAVFTAASAASAQTGPTSGVQGAKTVTGNTSGWTRDIVINLSCPAADVDRDFHVPPGLPGNYQLGVTTRRDAVELHRRRDRIGAPTDR